MLDSISTFWARCSAITTGSPEVIGRRVAFMISPAACSMSGINEVHSMISEKLEASMELYSLLLSNCRPPAWAEVVVPGLGLVRTANELLKPLSERVEANVGRLRASSPV